MTVTTTIDKAGRVVVPKAIRDALHLKAGDELEIESDGEALTLRQHRAQATLKLKNGFWVVDTGGRVTTEMVKDLLNEIREEHERRILGE